MSWFFGKKKGETEKEKQMKAYQEWRKNEDEKLKRDIISDAFSGDRNKMAQMVIYRDPKLIKKHLQDLDKQYEDLMTQAKEARIPPALREELIRDTMYRANKKYPQNFISGGIIRPEIKIVRPINFI